VERNDGAERDGRAEVKAPAEERLARRGHAVEEYRAAELERVISEDLRDVVVDVVVALDRLRRQEDVAAEVTIALDVDLRPEGVVGEVPEARVAVLQLQFIIRGRAELVVVRAHGAAVESSVPAAARDGRQRPRRLVFKIAVGQVEAQVADAPFAETVVKPRRKLRLRFVKRELPAGVGEELDRAWKRRRRRRQRASQPCGQRGEWLDAAQEVEQRVLRRRRLENALVAEQIDESGARLAQSLDGREEKCSVLPDRAAERAAVLLPVEWRFAVGVEVESVARV